MTLTCPHCRQPFALVAVAAGMAPQAQPVNGSWRCPVHGGAKLVPAGVSKKTGKAYGAFAACPVQDCPEKEPFHTSPAPVAPPPAYAAPLPTPTADDLDGLPF